MEHERAREWIRARLRPSRIGSQSSDFGRVRGGTSTALGFAMLNDAQRRRVLANLDLVHSLARRLQHRYRITVAIDELVSFGMMGLVEAARRFDASRGVEFGAFARRRVQGAIIDGLDELGPLSRRKYRSRRHVRGSDRADSVICRRESAAESLGRHQLSTALLVAVRTLPPRARYVLERRYWDRQTLVVIGRELGVSKSRASRIHSAALRKLRAALSEGLQMGDDTLDAELAQVA